MQTNAHLKEPRRTRLGAAALSILVTLSGVACTAPRASADAGAALQTPRQQAGGMRASFSSVVEPASRAVVSIRSTKVLAAAHGRRGQVPDGFPFPLPFGPDFGAPEERESEGLGSGVIVKADGTILTNNHVVDDADQLRVSLTDGREFTAKVVGTDKQTDLAVLKIDAKDLPVLPLGHSGDLRVGDLVFAIGNPFGVGETVTMGIVGATGRSRLGLIGSGGYENFIQTDASINPGNSGGALIDSNGELIGINTAIIANGSRGSQGIGFAVPVDMASSVMRQLVSGGKVTRAYLGIQIGDLGPAAATAMGLPSSDGALVGKVLPDTPAARAGLKPGDVITELDGEPVKDDIAFRMSVAGRAPGSRVKLGVVRDKQPKTLEVTLDELKDGDVAESAGGEDEVDHDALRGVKVHDLSPQVRRQAGIDADVQGVLVVDVSGHPAMAAGLQQGDVITQVAGKKVTTVAEFRQRVREAGDGAVPLLIVRDDTTVFLVIEP